MLTYALTDGAAALAGIFGVVLLGCRVPDKIAIYGQLGVATMALAALVGTVRFAFNVPAPIELVHLRLTEFSAVAGMLLVAIALAGTVQPSFVRRLSSMVTLAFVSSVFGIATMSQQLVGTSLACSSIAMIACIWTSVTLFQRGGVIQAARAIVLAVLMITIGAVPRVIASESLSFHVFHLVLAIWLVVLSCHIFDHTKKDYRPDASY